MIDRVSPLLNHLVFLLRMLNAAFVGKKSEKPGTTVAVRLQCQVLAIDYTQRILDLNSFQRDECNSEIPTSRNGFGTANTWPYAGVTAAQRCSYCNLSDFCSKK